MSELRKKMRSASVEYMAQAAREVSGPSAKQVDYIEGLLLDTGLFECQDEWFTELLGRKVARIDRLQSFEAAKVVNALLARKRELDEDRCWGPSGLDELAGCIGKGEYSEDQCEFT